MMASLTILMALTGLIMVVETSLVSKVVIWFIYTFI